MTNNDTRVNNDNSLLISVIEEFLIYQESVRNLSKNSIIGYKNDLITLVRIIEEKKELAKDAILINSIKLQDLRYCISVLSKEKKTQATINRFIAAVRSLFRYSRRMGYLQNDPAMELKNVKMPVRVPQFMTQTEIDEICTIPEEKDILWPTRDKAIFEVLYSSGCRVGELASLKLKDISGDYSSAIVIGKGSKERRVFFSEDAKKALKDYLLERKMKINTEVNNSKVFINQKGQSLTTEGIRYIVRRYSSVEGTNKPITPHAFRHTFATSMLSNGADIRVVQELLGHSNISTTQCYTHITTKELVEIYKKAHPHGKS